VKASAGAVENLLLAPVDDLPGALTDLHVKGLRIVGSEADAPLPVRQADLRGPVAVVVGSEGQGLGPAVHRRADLLVRIPMRGAIGSLNAAVAGSILVFEVLAQRDPEGRARPQPSPSAAVAEAEETDPEKAPPKAKRSRKSAPAEATELAPEERRSKPKRRSPTVAAPPPEAEPAAAEAAADGSDPDLLPDGPPSDQDER
jgi:tRNA(Leu) C34 or U34 (ribose-2'-O)-methylase TrmL